MSRRLPRTGPRKTIQQVRRETKQWVYERGLATGQLSPSPSQPALQNLPIKLTKEGKALSRSIVRAFAPFDRWANGNQYSAFNSDED